MIPPAAQFHVRSGSSGCLLSLLRKFTRPQLGHLTGPMPATMRAQLAAAKFLVCTPQSNQATHAQRLGLPAPPTPNTSQATFSANRLAPLHRNAVLVANSGRAATEKNAKRKQPSVFLHFTAACDSTLKKANLCTDSLDGHLLNLLRHRRPKSRSSRKLAACSQLFGSLAAALPKRFHARQRAGRACSPQPAP